MLAGQGNYGFDAGRKEYVDLVEAGIIDPTKVVASIPAKELPVGQAVPRRVVNVRIPRILIRMQERAEEVPRSQRR